MEKVERRWNAKTEAKLFKKGRARTIEKERIMYVLYLFVVLLSKGIIEVAIPRTISVAITTMRAVPRMEA